MARAGLGPLVLRRSGLDMERSLVVSLADVQTGRKRAAVITLRTFVEHARGGQNL